MWKKGLWALLALVLVGVGGFFALGGKEGVAVLVVRYLVRETAAAPRAVQWQTGGAPAAAAGRRPPNIVLIVADDLGYNDISLHGGGVAAGSVPTPHIDSIAREGVYFDAGYSGNATCAPSRAAIMTGRYATRFGFEFTPTPVRFARMVGGFRPASSPRLPIYHAEREAGLLPYEDQGLPRSEITLARLLKGAGYRTLHLGKWHLGDSPGFRPHAHGFDESLHMPHGASMFLPEDHPQVVNSKQSFDPIDKFLWASHPWAVRFNDSELFQPPRYMTDYLTDEAIRAIAANRNRPFFMYLAYNAPHTPLQATREDVDALAHIADPTTRVYAAMIRSLDRNIGRLLKSLRDQGLEDNTLVVFTSDNGGAHYIGIEGINRPFRAWKATYFEGGTHVPFMMRWPGVLPRGARYPHPVSHFDIFGTAAAAAGAARPTDRIIDGVDLLPFVTGRNSGAPHAHLFWRGGDYRAVRAGDWKLQLTQRPQQAWLYNLASDPGERTNLAAQEPERVAALRAQIEAWDRQQARPLWPALIEAPIPLDKTLRDTQTVSDPHIYFSN